MMTRTTSTIPKSRSTAIGPARGRPAGPLVQEGPLDREALASIQATAGNQAANDVVEQGGAWFTIQRAPKAASDPADEPVTPAHGVGGWTGADKHGKSWNAGEKDIGTIRRIPIEGLDIGKQSEESATNTALTEESAAGRAILVAPQGIDPTVPVDVMVHFHGYTETASRPYAGWRQNRNTGAVRDVALDRVEQQLQAARGESQLVAILAQGGTRSEFGEGGGKYALDPAGYARAVIDKATEIGAWGPNAPDPDIGRTILSGHSGGAHTISHALAAELDMPKKGKKGGKAKVKGASAFDEVVLFDAITGSSELEVFIAWVGARLDADLAALNAAPTAEAKSSYLASSTRFRGYYATYVAYYTALEQSIENWFKKNLAELGPYAEELWTHYQVINAGGSHENVMRGSAPGTKNPGPGNITNAIEALGAPTAKKTLAETLKGKAPKVKTSKVRGRKKTSRRAGSPPAPGTAPDPVSADGRPGPAETPKLGRHVADASASQDAAPAPVPETALEPDPGDPTSKSTAAFIGDLGRTTLELLPKAQRARFEAIAWVDLDYPRSKALIKDTDGDNAAKWRADPNYVVFEVKGKLYRKGVHQDDAQRLFNALMSVRPGGGERRANTSSTAILTKEQFKQDPAAYDEYIRQELDDVQTESVKMNKYAAVKYVEMKAAAKKEGVRLSIGNAFRDRKKAEARAAKADNSSAVASYSSHSLGLAMDLNLRVRGMAKAKEVTTAMTNITSLLVAPAYKWMFMRGASFNFYQYANEPWHWEYNPEGFREKFWADMPDLQPAPEAESKSHKKKAKA
ncbi:MAG: D-alanyl-D-alanine carboxypeptidase family protein [Candidatus Limnocylindrales bacterium]